MRSQKPDRIKLLGVEIDNVTFNEALIQICRLVDDRKYPSYIVTPNVAHLMLLQKDFLFKEIYRRAALVLPDGMPILWAAQFLGTPLKEKISGSDLFPRLCELSTKRAYTLFFLGGRPEAAAKAANVIRKEYPGIRIVGTYCPPFGFEKNNNENDKIVRIIKKAKPDILFVGLGAPKQEKWIYRHKDLYNVPVSIGIGASFEFVAGVIKRAPLWMQKRGLEWLFRIYQEPRRMWKRYAKTNPVFVWMVVREYLKLKANRSSK